MQGSEVQVPRVQGPHGHVLIRTDQGNAREGPRQGALRGAQAQVGARMRSLWLVVWVLKTRMLQGLGRKGCGDVPGHALVHNVRGRRYHWRRACSYQHTLIRMSPPRKELQMVTGDSQQFPKRPEYSGPAPPWLAGPTRLLIRSCCG